MILLLIVGSSAIISEKNRDAKGYNSNFTIVRFKGGVAVNDSAVTAADHLTFWQKFSHCSNVVDEIFGGNFSGTQLEKNLKGIGGLLISLMQIPSTRYLHTRTTPSSLARSEKVEKICVVENNKLIYPSSVEISKILSWANDSLKASNISLQNHGKQVLQYLKGNNFIDENNEILIQVLNFSKP